MGENYQRLVNIISKSSGLSKEEIDNKVKEKRDRISGMISEEGAAQIIAAELGISFDNEKLKIEDLMPGMKKVNVLGKVISLYPVRSFTTKNGQEGKVANMIIADDTSNVKAVLWDVNHIQHIESGTISEGSVVEIHNASMRENEIHLGSFSEFKPSSESLENVITEKIVKEKNISDFRPSDNTSVRAFIVQAFDPRFFNVCPECKKKVNPDGEGFACNTHGKVNPERRALMNIVLDDGTESIRAVLFHEKLNDIGIQNPDDYELMNKQKEDILGKEMIFSGTVRQNTYFNTTELTINEAKETNVDELLQKLEKS